MFPYECCCKSIFFVYIYTCIYNKNFKTHFTRKLVWQNWSEILQKILHNFY